MSTSGPPTTAPRRQARGRRRIETILDAAGRVFATVGYGAATTNAIAAEAGISPGSLYQFFANKDEIAAALEARYATALRGVAESAATVADGPPSEAVDRLVDLTVEFALALPGFGALFVERPMPAPLAEETRALHLALIGRVGAILDTRRPDLLPAERARMAGVAVQLCRSLTSLIVVTGRGERERLVADLKRILADYLR